MAAQRNSVLLLDLDGTLVDSAPDLATALNLLLAERGAPPLALAEVAAMVGDGARKLVERGFAARGLGGDPGEATERFLALYTPRVLEKTRPYPGVAAVLSELAADGWRLAVCTNKPLALSEAILVGLRLRPHFAVVAGGDSFAVKKPDPRHLELTLKAIGSSPEAVVMVGDGRNDLLAAAAAKLPAVWAAYGYGGGEAESLPRAARIAAFTDLPRCLSQLEAGSLRRGRLEPT